MSEPHNTTYLGREGPPPREDEPTHGQTLGGDGRLSSPYRETASYTVTPAVPSPVQTSTVTSGDVPGIYAVLVTFPGDVSAWAVYQEGEEDTVSTGSAHDTHEAAARYLGRHLRSYRHRTRREDA